MGIGFLVPLFLAGLAAVGVPILVHLRHREWERPHRFPSLMFLRRIPIRTARRRRITDWLLLALRVAVLVLLTAAFARPFFRRRELAGAAEPARAVVLLLDRSLSMSHRSVWPAALDSARRIVGSLRPEDRIAVIRFDDRAEVAQPLTTDHAAALAAVSATRPVARGTRYAAALRVARQVFTAAALERGEVLVVTDLQRSGLTGLAGLELPGGIAVRAVSGGPDSRENASLLSADAQRIPSAGRSDLLITARVAARRLPVPRRTRVSLTVAGRSAGIREVTLPVEGVATVAFDRVPVGAAAVRAAVALEPDALPGDDTLRVVVPAEAALRILLVVPPRARPEETLFLERALTIGQDPRFIVERRSALDPAVLREGSAAVVIFQDARPPAPEGPAGTALDRWVRGGGGLIVVAGPRLGARGSPLIPGKVTGLVERLDPAGVGGSFGEIALEHPIFAPFREAGAAGLGAVRFLRYARLEPESGSRTLARFDDGNPALVERTHDAGRLFLLAAPLDNVMGDFPLQPAYLPFLRRLAVYAAGHQVTPLWRTTGETGIVRGAVPDPVVSTPDGGLLRPAADSGPRTFPFDAAGFYETYAARAAGEPLEVTAVNPPAAESDLTPADPRELLIGVRQGDAAAVAARPNPAPADREARQNVWRWLLVLAAVLLLLEAVVANRGWRGTASSVLPPPPSPAAEGNVP